MRESLRRRTLKAGKLIKFPDMTNFVYNTSVTQEKISISNGNHFNFNGYRRSTAGTAYVNLTTAQNAVPSGWPSFIDLHAGDKIVMKLKNVDVYNNQTASYNGYIQVTLRDASNTFIVGFAGSTSDSPLYVTGKQRKNYDELVDTRTISADTSACILRFYEYGTAQAINIDLICDIEVYVNGERVI